MKTIDFKEFRKQNNLQQKDLADYLGISVTFLSQIETRKRKLPKEKLSKLLSNDKGWNVADFIVEIEEDDGFSLLPKNLCGPSNDIEKLLQENAMLKERCAQLEDQNGKFWALIEKLTNKK